MASTDEKVKVILDISDVVVKRAQEINEAKKAEKEKIAALKRETAAAAKEDKEAWANAVAAAKAKAAEEAKQAKYIADLKRKYFEQEQREAEKAAKAAEHAAKGPSEWTLALRANTEAMSAQKAQINQAAEGFGKLGSALAAVDPQLGAITMGAQKAVNVMSAGATAAQGLGATFGTVAAVAGPLALAIGAVALAFNAYEDDIKEAEEATKKLREEQEKLNQAMAGIGSLLDANASEVDRLKVNYGELSEEQFQLNELGRRWSAQLESTRAPLEAMRDELLRTNDASREHADKLVAVEEALRNANVAAAIGYEAAKENAAIARERNESEATLAQRLQDREEAERRATEATREANDAAQEAARIAAERAQRNKDFVAGNIAAAEADIAAEEARTRAYEDAGARREQLFIRDQEQIEATANADKEATKKRLDNAAMLSSTAANIADAIGSLYEDAADRSAEHVSDLQDEREEALEEGNESLAKVLEAQIEAEKESALKQWNNAHKLAIAAAGLDLVAGVAKAATGAPWPFNLALMAGAAATGTANLVAVKNQEPPEFDDTPQVMQAAQNNRTNVSLKGGDLFAAAQTPAALKQQVDAMAGGNRTMRIADRMNDLLVGRSMTHDLRMVMGRA